MPVMQVGQSLFFHYSLKKKRKKKKRGRGHGTEDRTLGSNRLEDSVHLDSKYVLERATGCRPRAIARLPGGRGRHRPYAPII